MREHPKETKKEEEYREVTGRGESVFLNLPCLLLKSTGLRAAATTLIRTWSSSNWGTETFVSNFKTSTPPYSSYTHAFISDGTVEASAEAGAASYFADTLRAGTAESWHVWRVQLVALVLLLVSRNVEENLREIGFGDRE